MILPVEELKKETLGDTYKFINNLLQEVDFDPKAYVKYRLKSSVFEKKVQAIIIDTFRLKEGVINCLLSDDPHLLRRILKCNWFFEDAIPPKRYEEEIFPHVSFSTRCKIINQLSRNVKSEKDADELFEFINANYGSKYAEMLLCKCSAECVTHYFNNCKPSFTNHDSEKNLINISKRFPDIVIAFLQKAMSEDDFRGSKVVKYLAKSDPASVIPIVQKYYTDLYFFRFGKKTTKALCSEFMTLAENAPSIILMDKLKLSVMFKRLSYEEQVTFLKLLVKENRSDFDYTGIHDWPRALPQMKHFLGLIPSSQRPRLVEAVFYELYNENYLDHPEVWSLNFTEVFPEDYRHNLVDILDRMCGEKAVIDALRAECKDRERNVKNTYIYLMGFHTAFPMLTELMTEMSTIGRREMLLKEMVHNCIINREIDGLESVARYISIRHKNEDPRVISNLIYYCVTTSPEIINLEVWEWVEKMVTLLLVKLGDAHVFGVVMEEYIAYRLANNLDAQPQVKSLMKLGMAPQQGSFILVRKIDKPYSRAMIMLLYKEISNFSGDYSVRHIKEKLMLSLLMTVNCYNRNKKSTRIRMEELPVMVRNLDLMVRNVSDWKAKHLLCKAIKKNKYLRNKYTHYLLDMSMKPKMLKYLIKYHPYYVMNNFNRILTHMLEFSEDTKLQKVFAFGSQMDFLGYMPELRKAISDRFRNSNVASVKVKALRAYSHIASAQNFKTLTKIYVPEEERLNYDPSRAEFYEIQVSVPGMIGNLVPVSKNFEFLSKYLKKDFVRLVLPSFFAFCHNSSVSAVVPILKEYFRKKTDVAVRKVILCCIMDLLPKAERFQQCRVLWENERHSAVREFVFHAILRNLREDKSEEVFDMVKRCIRESEETTINGRLKMKMIPLKYVSEYSTALWEFTERFEGKNVSTTCRKEIVNHFNGKNISVLPEEFCQKILRLYLFEAKGDVKVEKFCVNYVLHHPQPIDEKVALILRLLRDSRSEVGPIIYFVHRLKYYARDHPKAVFTLFDGLLRVWQSVFGTCKMFRQYLLLNYMKAFSKALKASSSRKDLFGAVLGEEFRKIVNSIPNYDSFLEVFKSTMSDFIEYFMFYDGLDRLIDSFLGNAFGIVEGIIAIHLMPAKAFDSYKMDVEHPDYKNSYLVELRGKYSGIFKKLLDKNDDVLKIFINLRMGNALD